MNYLEYILLGVVQGLTEFFPISSSGHLLLLRKLFGINEGGLLIEVALHLGTLLSILFFWKNFIGEKIQETFKGNFNYLSIIVVGSIPASIVGLLFEDQIKEYFFDISSMNYLIICYIVLTIIIFSTKYFIDNKNSKITYAYAFLIGMAQAMAIIPGLSRSGLTIFMALLLGLSFKKSMQFSFMLAIPIISGAGLLNALDDTHIIEIPIDIGLVGFLSSFFIGFIALKWLLSLLEKGKLYYFGIYCFLVGIFSILI